MKIKVKELPYEQVLKLKRSIHHNPMNPNPLLKRLIKFLADSDLKKVNFKSSEINMDKVEKNTPCLILMNHSSFIDLEIASKLLYPNNFHIVCTSDGFVGKELLMRAIGCIPTQKFVTDVNLVKDMKYALTKLKNSVLMYPEASYSFDGTATALPESLGKCIKLLNVPVLMIKTEGAFLRDPLYNMLKKRSVDVSATLECILTPEMIKEKSAGEINEILKSGFSFDYFKSQQEGRIRVSEDFRADGLNRVLYKCPHCNAEGSMVGKGISISCGACNTTYELDEYGFLKNINGETKFSHIPDWYRWERECVRKDIEEKRYRLETAVDIIMMINRKAVYKVGEGILEHSEKGFKLTGCEGKLSYAQKPSDSYSLYSDYFWYELGDMICIGDMKTSYYCFPKGTGDIVAKTRLAAEELFKIDRETKVARN